MTITDPQNAGEEVLITFEDVDLLDQAIGPLPSGYMGFTWSGSAWFASRTFTSSICPGIGGRVGLLNADGQDITIASERLFDFIGLSLCAIWRDQATVRVEGWGRGIQKYTASTVVQRAVTTQCALDWYGVDRVELKTEGAHVLISDITVRFT